MADRGKGFPRLSLGSAVQILEKASKFGKSWPKAQFAGFGSKSGAGSAKSGAFAARVSALRDYGLVISDKSTVSLTELALKIVKPVTDTEKKEALRQSFLAVDTFRQLFEHLESGIELPLDLAAEHAVFTIGISRESKDRFIGSFIESGKFVGLVKYNKESNTIVLEKDVEPQLDTAQGEDRTKSEETDDSKAVEPQLILDPTPQLPMANSPDDSGHDLNKIEIVLREGVKAGIYAPYNLSVAEKDKLKSIIDLL